MGSSPKAPPAPPDPAIAAEQARQEAIAIGQADARRTTMYGSTSLVKSQGVAAGKTNARPTDPIPTGGDPLAGTDLLAEINTKQGHLDAGTVPTKTVDTSQGPDDGSTSEVPQYTQSDVDNLRKVSDEGATQSQVPIGGNNKLFGGMTTTKTSSLSPVDQIKFNAAKKERAVGEYINRTRKRVGVTATGARV